ncbi:hypothetical protein CapIbe_010883 [Capra ibex]
MNSIHDGKLFVSLIQASCRRVEMLLQHGTLWVYCPNLIIQSRNGSWKGRGTHPETTYRARSVPGSPALYLMLQLA